MRLAVLALAAVATSASAATCTGPVCNLEALAPYFAKLAVAHGARGAPPVHVLQIGDSHTAGDAVTGAWRTLLQAQYGGGGRGVLAPGRPYDGYITRGVTASMSPGWSVGASFGKSAQEPRPLLGLSGFSLTSTRSGASMALSAEPGMVFDRFTLCAIGGPGAGGVTVRFGGEDKGRLDFTLPDTRPLCRTIRAETPQASVEIVADAPSLTITSWSTFRDDGGVALSNLGVVGSQLMHFARTDDGVVAEELKAYSPDLIVLAFGTNEGFTPRFDPVGYEATLRTQIGRLRRLSGNVPMLLLGAPDSLSRNPTLRGNAPGSPLECEESARPLGYGAPAAIADMPAGATSGNSEAQVKPVAAQATQRPPLFAPPALAIVRRIQRKVAGDLGLAYWDWQARMGGPCSARDWTQRAEPLMRGDYVHFRSAGGLEIARRLQADLDRSAAGVVR
jgi:hypothetical protein